MNAPTSEGQGYILNESGRCLFLRVAASSNYYYNVRSKWRKSKGVMRMCTIVKQLIPGLVCLVLAACGGGGGNGTTTATGGNPNPGTGGGQVAQLEGAWVGGACEDATGTNSGEVFSKDSYTFTGNAAVITADFFADSDCNTPIESVDQSGFGLGFTIPNQFKATATFVIGNDITTGNGAPATEIDYQNVNATNGSGGPLPADLVPDSDLFDIFSIDTSGNLFFADDAGDAQDGRPQELDFSNTLVQQGGGTAPPDGGGQVTVLEGAWSAQACIDTDDEDPGRLFANGGVTFTGNTAVTVVNFFTDSNCSIPVSSVAQPGAVSPLSDQIIITETFVIGNDVETDSGVTATEIDSQEVSVTDGSGEVLPNPLAGIIGDTTDFDIFFIDASGGLFFGVDIGDTPATRPTALDFAIGPLVRQ